MHKQACPKPRRVLLGGSRDRDPPVSRPFREAAIHASALERPREQLILNQVRPKLRQAEACARDLTGRVFVDSDPYASKPHHASYPDPFFRAALRLPFCEQELQFWLLVPYPCEN